MGVHDSAPTLNGETASASVTQPKLESKNAINARMKRGPCWNAFVARREELKASGVPALDAIRQAAAEVDSGSLTEEYRADASLKPRLASHQVEEPEAPEGLPSLKPAPGHIFPDVKVNHGETVEWVASQLGVEDPKPEDAPSSTAWSLLVWARSSSGCTRDFWTTHYAKLISQGNKRGGLAVDDDEAVLTIIAKVESASLRALAPHTMAPPTAEVAA